MSTRQTFDMDNHSLITTSLDQPQFDLSNRNSIIRVDGAVRQSYEENRERSKWPVYILLVGFVLFLVSIGSSLQHSLIIHPPKNLIRHVRPEKRIQRLALLRPFGTRMISSMPDSFDTWEKYLPCDLDHQDKEVVVDIFLSYSQTYDSNKIAQESSEKLLEKFLSSRNQEDQKGWARCFRNIQFIEASIPPSEDLYLPPESNTNRLWVNGPNQQFVSSMEQILKNTEQYDVVLLLEHDCDPVKQFWLDTFLAEAENGESFAILGSKYDGDSWNSFRSSLPLALQHHINGNAMYNMTHPLTRKILMQLREESDTPYRAIPYDYRISQMLIEGMLGVKPDLPEMVVQKWEEKTGRNLKSYSKRFHRWWNKYDEGKLIRESKVIANYASTNLLPHHLQEETASLIHGAKHYLPWDKSRHNITLVVSDWHDELSFNLLYQIDSTDHSFSNLILLVPDNIPKRSIVHLSSAKTEINLTIQKRKNDFFDVCNADVKTEWFMITNSYHIIADHVNLLFNEDYKPVIPYTPADHQNCVTFPACREAYEKSKQFDPNNMMIVQDDQIIFNTKETNEFCAEWRNRFGENRMDTGILDLDESIGTMGPSASTYIAYLSAKGSLSSIYEFTDQTFYGARENFKRIFTEAAEKAAIYGETPLANYILQNGSRASGQMLHMERVLQNQAPSFSGATPPQIQTLSPTMSLKTRSPTFKPTSRPSVEPPPLFLLFSDGEDNGNALNTATPTVSSKSPSSPPSIITSSPTSSPIKTNNKNNDEEDKLEEIRACKSWCYLISTPWTSVDRAVFPKCLWKFSCGSCPECQNS